ncbi:MAG: hypothetical protein ABWX70_06650 [Hyphomicrobium sp.]
MSAYLSDTLLLLSLIAPPIILGLLLFHGISERKFDDAGKERQRANTSPKVYPSPEREPRVKEKKTTPSPRSSDVVERPTGTSI